MRSAKNKGRDVGKVPWQHIVGAFDVVKTELWETTSQWDTTMGNCNESRGWCGVEGSVRIVHK